jgi:putative restriction endonuclease
MFEVGALYTRAQIQDALDVPEDRRGGDWATGYTTYDGQVYVFCNVGSAGRTGHDYPNRWDGSQLIWSAKSRSNIHQPLIQRMITGDTQVNIFHRSSDRSPFAYAGVGRVVEISDTTPVVVRWAFADPASSAPFKMLSANDIADELVGLGFDLGEARVKTRRASRGSTTLYIKIDSGSSPLVIGPSFEEGVSALSALPGVHRPTGRLFYHNSTMRSFPMRLHGGKSPIPFGIDFDFSSRGAVREFVAALEAMPKRQLNEQSQSADEMAVDPRTESEAVRAARLGQQKFRSDLLDEWNGRCALTGLAMPELLRASHIKPWCDCEPRERLDPGNGILLAVHIDCLFDRGFISFDDDGGILLSPKLTSETLKCFGLTPEARLPRVDVEQRRYLDHHRKLHAKKLQLEPRR